MPFTGNEGILQLHPTRRCNLTCPHCYSDSGPGARDELPVDLLCRVVGDAAGLGYSVLSVSGGEPLLYRHLPELLAHAHDCGLRTTVTTNGTVTARRRLEAVTPHLDLLALSLDGPPDDHDLMRSRPGAFRSLGVTTATLRELNVPFGFLFTLTQHNVHQIEWAVGHAVAEGAAMLQIHPLEATGRGAAMASAVPDRFECAVAVLEAARLRRGAGDRLHIQVDLAVRPVLPADPADAPLGRIVSPLVVEPDGRCVPLEYGFPESFALGNVCRAPLRELAALWREERLPRFLALCRDTSERLRRADAAPVTSWYAAVAAAARELLPEGR